MKSAILIFPNQLFEKHPALAKNRFIYLIEEALFFTQYNFHKQKLVFHRASMKFYEKNLVSKNYEVKYIESGSDISDIRKLITHLKKEGFSEIHFADVVDNWLEKRINETASSTDIKIKVYDSPGFINSGEEIKKYFNGKKNYSQTSFYIQQRKKLDLLIDDEAKPIGGKWTYDSENRKKYPADKKPPAISFPQANKFYSEALAYVEEHFPDNYGSINEQFIYLVTFNESKKWLNQFLDKRFEEFGPYEDAIVSSENILHHSLLSPLMNAGLLTPEYVVNQAVLFAEHNNIPINSLEGFIRQINGWREFIRGVYETVGTKQRTKNFWKFKRKLPESFWDGNTGIDPLDITIKKVLDTGYCHHIERLMVIGNFMLLCEFDPDDVYKWFMEMFIDSYDWVMVPNVYGMSQFADGGLMATKPYISGSNYLMKMSDYKKGDWQEIWDGLFWRFMDKHRTFFLSNPRLGMLIKTFDKMEKSKKQKLLNSAENYLNSLP
jgi:deoxyribodipyrimidine photolyase-related protein